ncbi:carboxypeptidase regulatory-like domain-containing protein [Spirosoma sp. KCTC 42546]|uniref:carboxypeptidase-like regulatory domain-containing protein n=1 Tax=Spirosoma sp. KCTC 42546 TaxID=2520506 RepID=UPI001159F801|nr:carboxypeptidase-like regulatory domain-containing protein [Spirosoma sp. KCTC 42546]QDK78701.1 carboxypeptidase regulatory-like domain-containing protein [Spirosoma sp. KCTC 42546]
MKNLQAFRSLTGTALLLLGSLFALTACDKKPVDPNGPMPTDPGTPGQAGYLVGKVIDPQGKPLPKATVFVDHTVLTGDGPEVKTAADGTYKVQMTDFAGEWIAKGYLLKQYNDRVYKINLDPEDDSPFTSNEKAVRNFQWKLTGHIPDLSLDLYYGGTMEMSRDLNADDLRDNENIEFTLTPVGPLIDGSTGKVLKVQAKKRYNDAIKDVPMGRYKVTAVYKPTGEQLLVRNAWDFDSDIVYQPSVTMDFLGTESAVRYNSMCVGYTNRH